jgi:O-antigen/teichoic acid export membrane protein
VTAEVSTAGSGARALRNSALILVARIVGRLLALVTVVLIGNGLGDSGFGAMQTALTYSLIISTVADLGFSTLYVREGARSPTQVGRFLNNMLSVRVPLLVVAVLVLCGALWLIGLTSLIVPTAALMVISGYQLMLRNTLYALQRLGFEILEIVPEALLLLAIVVIGYAGHHGAGFYLWAYTLSYVAAAIYFAIVLIAIGVWRPAWKMEMELLKPWLRSSLPLAITYIFTTVYWKVDVPILQRYTDFQQVGWYTLAYKPFESLLFVPMTLRTVVFPVLSVYHTHRPDRLGIATEKFFKALLALGLPMTVGIVLLAQQYNDLLHLFPQSAAALQILGFAVVFLFVDNTFAAALLATDRQGLFAWIAVSGLIVNVVLNTVLIPVFEGMHPGSGYLVASWNVVGTEVCLVIAGWVSLRRVGIPIAVHRVGWRVVVAAAVMGAAIWLVNPHGAVAVIGTTLAAGALYLGLLWLIGGADDEEKLLLRRALRR